MLVVILYSEFERLAQLFRIESASCNLQRKKMAKIARILTTTPKCALERIQISQ